MNKIEDVVSNDIKQDQRLKSVELSLQRGNQRFQEIEGRLNMLEDAEGNKAKTIMSKIISYVATALLGFIAAAVTAYVQQRGG